MNKKFGWSLFLSLVTLFSTHAYSQNINQMLDIEQPRSLTATPELSSLGKPILAKTQDFQEDADIARAPAPPLTEMYVYAVGSQNCGGWEYTAGLITTVCDHGGSWMGAGILEIGYGTSRIAWMNGSLLPSSALIASTPVCVTGGYYTWPCTAGQTVVGFLREYNLNGNQSGTFRYQSTSINSPWNTMSVQIYIR